MLHDLSVTAALPPDGVLTRHLAAAAPAGLGSLEVGASLHVSQLSTTNAELNVLSAYQLPKRNKEKQLDVCPFKY